MDWPDIIALLVPYLGGKTDATVASRVPNPRPAKLVQVRRVGGPKLAPVRDNPRVDVLCWAPTEPEAMALLLAMRAEINNLHGTTLDGVVIYNIEETLGPRQDDDLQTGTPVAWMTFSIIHRADGAIY